MIDVIQTLKNLNKEFPRYQLETLIKIVDCVVEKYDYKWYCNKCNDSGTIWPWTTTCYNVDDCTQLTTSHYNPEAALQAAEVPLD